MASSRSSISILGIRVGGCSSASSSSSEGSIKFPADFPLDVDVYDQIQFKDYNPPKLPLADPKDPRRRAFDSLYPLKWLVADQSGAFASSSAPVGCLRTQLPQTFQQNAKGEWKHVEYVPSWSDPDWGTRYTYTKDSTNAGQDQMTQSYARAGLLQAQRPALRADDAALNPTEAAKRWGIYPWQTWNGLQGQLSPKGWSGVTPQMAGFPVVQLNQPQFSPDAGGYVDVVTIQDLSNERQRFNAGMRPQDVEATDEGFEQYLRDVASDPNVGAVKTEKAASLLALLEAWERKEETEEYQRLIFGGNTTNELVEQGVWTTGADAYTDLANPLHDLLTRDKWATTDDLGAKKDTPRLVYDLSGKQGEYTAHNDVIWTALQPALQLVTQVLNSQHPATWVWADIRKLRPVEDYRGSTSTRFWKFYTSSDLSVDVPSLRGEALNWAEFIDICTAGFDTTGYVCEILKQTIEWEFGCNWRIYGPDASDANKAGSRAYGTTMVVRTKKSQSEPPFKIKIQLAAECTWPLLADEYSTAEKAASSLFIATTMLHELSHALVLARCQMFMPGTLKPGDEPLWLTLQPSWSQLIAEFNAQNNVNILDCLQRFGNRMKYLEPAYVDKGIFFPSHEVFWLNEPDGEEGWATENQYFGGIFEPLAAASLTALPMLDHYRFLEEATYVGSMRGWATDLGAAERFVIHGPLAMSEYQKLYSKTWWNADFMAYGSAALKLFNIGAPVRSGIDLREWHVNRLWLFVEKRYGPDARDWLQRVWRRMKPESANQLLWRHLSYQLIAATEVEACEHTWSDIQKDWDRTDLAAWNDRIAAVDSATALDAALAQVSDRNLDAIFFQNAVRPVDEFRRLSASFWHVQSILTREATYFQNVAVQFINLDDRDAKDRLFRQYAGRIRDRITKLYMRIITDLNDILDALDTLITNSPRITGWLTTDPDIAQIWTRCSTELREKLRINSRFFDTVRGVFHEDPAQRVSAVDQMGAIPSGAAQTLASRLRRIGMRQYHALAPTDPRRRVADDWMAILSNGDLLRNPAPSSPAAQFNQQLHNRVAGIDAGVTAHQQMVANTHPDPQMLRQMGNSTALVNQQASVSGPYDRSGVLTAEVQAAYTLAVGFQPYRDATTGFTHFADVRAQQPNFQQQQNLTDPQLQSLMDPRLLQQQQQQQQQAPGQGLGSLQTRINNTAAQLQQMAQPQGQPLGLATPAPTIFGSAAAQQGQAIQQIEQLVGQRAAMQNPVQTGSFPGPGAAPFSPGVATQGQQFSHDQALWMQNQGP